MSLTSWVEFGITPRVSDKKDPKSDAGATQRLPSAVTEKVTALLAAGEKVRVELRREVAPLREVDESDLRLRLG